jgi:ABC-type phosphate transport system substrate-binding protein
MSRVRLAAPIVVLMLIVAGCGGSSVEVQEVPGDPVTLTVPGTAEGLAPQATATATGSATPTPTTTTTSGTTGQAPTDQTSASTGTGTAGGGTAAPSDGTDSATNDQPPPAGAPAQDFEEFCAQNPGAC